MLQNHSILRARIKRYLAPATLAAAALLLVGNATWADDGKGNGGKGNEAGDDRAVRLLQGHRQLVGSGQLNLRHRQ